MPPPGELFKRGKTACLPACLADRLRPLDEAQEETHRWRSSGSDAPSASTGLRAKVEMANATKEKHELNSTSDDKNH